jgi:hypothetical protein
MDFFVFIEQHIVTGFVYNLNPPILYKNLF